MTKPGLPKVAWAIEIIFLPEGRYRLTSRINKAPQVMSNQQAIRNSEDCQNPVAAFATGNASMPPPMDVPTIRSIPPKNFDRIIVSVV